jgi:pyruvate carboxylase
MEAMKMETSIKAERAAIIKRVVARIGEQFDAKDLLVELES